MAEIVRYVHARDLPPEWDDFCSDYFQTREFLIHCETGNPCRQEYFVHTTETGFSGGAVTYSLSIDLLTFLNLKSPVGMRICGIPCSVSASGLIGSPGAADACIDTVIREYRGLHVFLNLKQKPARGDLPAGTTFPTVIMTGLPGSWSEYRKRLRAPYRRWLNRILKKSERLIRRETPCHEFTENHYTLYLNVLGKSRGRLETLTHDFFRNLPARFVLESFYHGENLVGWDITVFWNGTYYFFLTGLDYRRLAAFDTYFVILSSILRRGLEAEARCIDLGQTTEWAKCRFGGHPELRFMAGHHTNPVINFLMSRAKGLLCYRNRTPDFHVFREDYREHSICTGKTIT